MSEALLASACDLLDRVQHQRATAVVFAPGRVNLIGEHTDYNDGWVLPCALAVGTAVAIAPRSDKEIVAVSRHLTSSTEIHDRFRVDRPIERDSENFWGNYLRGVVTAMQRSGITLDGADIAIVGDIPQGAGLSSSASLCVALARALLANCGPTAVAEVPPAQIAKWAQWSEHHFAGCQCGLMDQMAAAVATPGVAMLLDCRTLDTESLPLPAGITVLVAHSGVERKLASGEYNLRREQCAAAARGLGVDTLRDADHSLLQTRGTAISIVERQRARHVISENIRVTRAVTAIADRDLRELGRCLRESHESLRHDFEVTVPEVDELVEHLNRSIDDLAQGCGGARMTGGGFGGCVVAMVDSAAANQIEADVRRYLARRTAHPLVLSLTAANVAKR